jgi:hypothetical protein
MIYTKGPKTPSFTENRTFAPPSGDAGIRCLRRARFAALRQLHTRGVKYRSAGADLNLTSLYPIPSYCEGTLLPC